MKMYRTSYGTEIEEVEVARTTEKSVWVKHINMMDEEYVNRSLKWTSYEKYFDTHKEAWDFLHTELKQQVENKERWLNELKQQLESFEKTEKNNG